MNDNETSSMDNDERLLRLADPNGLAHWYIACIPRTTRKYFPCIDVLSTLFSETDWIVYNIQNFKETIRYKNLQALLKAYFAKGQSMAKHTPEPYELIFETDKRKSSSGVKIGKYGGTEYIRILWVALQAFSPLGKHMPNCHPEIDERLKSACAKLVPTLDVPQMKVTPEAAVALHEINLSIMKYEFNYPLYDDNPEHGTLPECLKSSFCFALTYFATCTNQENKPFKKLNDLIAASKHIFQFDCALRYNDSESETDDTEGREYTENTIKQWLTPGSDTCFGYLLNFNTSLIFANKIFKDDIALTGGVRISDEIRCCVTDLLINWHEIFIKELCSDASVQSPDIVINDQALTSFIDDHKDESSNYWFGVDKNNAVDPMFLYNSLIKKDRFKNKVYYKNGSLNAMAAKKWIEIAGKLINLLYDMIFHLACPYVNSSQLLSISYANNPNAETPIRNVFATSDGIVFVINTALRRSNGTIKGLPRLLPEILAKLLVYTLFYIRPIEIKFSEALGLLPDNQNDISHSVFANTATKSLFRSNISGNLKSIDDSVNHFPDLSVQQYRDTFEQYFVGIDRSIARPIDRACEPPEFFDFMMIVSWSLEIGTIQDFSFLDRITDIKIENKIIYDKILKKFKQFKNTLPHVDEYLYGISIYTSLSFFKEIKLPKSFTNEVNLHSHQRSHDKIVAARITYENDKLPVSTEFFRDSTLSGRSSSPSFSSRRSTSRTPESDADRSIKDNSELSTTDNGNSISEYDLVARNPKESVPRSGKTRRKKSKLSLGPSFDDPVEAGLLTFSFGLDDKDNSDDEETDNENNNHTGGNDHFSDDESVDMEKAEEARVEGVGTEVINREIDVPENDENEEEEAGLKSKLRDSENKIANGKGNSLVARDTVDEPAKEEEDEEGLKIIQVRQKRKTSNLLISDDEDELNSIPPSTVKGGKRSESKNLRVGSLNDKKSLTSKEGISTSEYSDQIKKLENEILEFKRRIKARDQRQDELKKENESLSLRLQKAENRNEQIKTGKSMLRSENLKLRAHVRRFSDAVNKMEGQLTAVKASDGYPEIIQDLQAEQRLVWENLESFKQLVENVHNEEDERVKKWEDERRYYQRMIDELEGKYVKIFLFFFNRLITHIL